MNPFTMGIAGNAIPGMIGAGAGVSAGGGGLMALLKKLGLGVNVLQQLQGGQSGGGFTPVSRAEQPQPAPAPGLGPLSRGPVDEAEIELLMRNLFGERGVPRAGW